jgi:hypothetical protein
LTAAGFTTAGIAGGSIAAAAQSSIGAVAAGSAFATLQSLGAAGTIVTGGLFGVGILAIGGAIFLGKKIYDKMKESEEKTKTEEEETKKKAEEKTKTEEEETKKRE